MITVQAPLSIIRWDEKFGRGDYEVGYHDGFVQKPLVVAMSDVCSDDSSGYAITVLDMEARPYRLLESQKERRA